MKINTSASYQIANEYMKKADKTLTSSLEELSTGLAINKASDDASGLTIADSLRTQASSLSQSIKNGNNAISMIQIADKAMDEQSKILDKVKSKLIQASTSTTSSEGRQAISKDVSKLLSQIDNIATQTKYNDKTLLNVQVNETNNSKVTIELAGYYTAGEVASLRYNGTEISDLLNDSGANLDAQSLVTGLVTGVNNNQQINYNSGTYINAGSADPGNLFSATKDGTKITLIKNDGTDIDLSLVTLVNESGVDITTTLTISKNYIESTKGLQFQLGSNSTDTISLSKSIDSSVSGLGLTSLKSAVDQNSDLSNLGLSQSGARGFLNTIDSAISTLNGFRSEYGSLQNEVESSVKNMMTQVTNLKSAESIIRDADITSSVSKFNIGSITSQASSFALNQVNSDSKNILSLLV